MSKKISPFAELTSSEKQIRWMEYQSIRLPYHEENIEKFAVDSVLPYLPSNEKTSVSTVTHQTGDTEVSKPMTFQSNHRHYDAVIARLKQAELQTRKQ